MIQKNHNQDNIDSIEHESIRIKREKSEHSQHDIIYSCRDEQPAPHM
jgi:hypothetical protein